MSKWKICYYLNESAYRCGCPAYTEIISGDRMFAVYWAQNKLKYSQFQFYDLIEL